MKKLLALILCVMMFVSVLSTSAFATTQYRPWNATAIENAIKTIKSNIDSVYNTMAADQGIVATSKAMDDITKELAKGITEAYGSTRTKAQKDAMTSALKANIGRLVWNYMGLHEDEFTDLDSTTGLLKIDPIKFMYTYANALNSTMTSADTVAHIEHEYYRALRANVMKSVMDDFNKFVTANAALSKTIRENYIPEGIADTTWDALGGFYTGFDTVGFTPDLTEYDWFGSDMFPGWMTENDVDWVLPDMP